jgi:hypothetical protein
VDQSDINGNWIGYVGIAADAACLLKDAMRNKAFGLWLVPSALWFATLSLLPFGVHNFGNRSIRVGVIFACLD